MITGSGPAGADFMALWRRIYLAWSEAIRPKECLSQEELLKQPVYVPHRPQEDPRELKILDPACGSGHFLLYCFDLLVEIYEEAWENGVIDRADFGLRSRPQVIPDTVR